MKSNETSPAQIKMAANKKSLVWGLVKELINGDRQCTLCEKFFNKNSANTTNLKGHLERHHTIAWNAHVSENAVPEVSKSTTVKTPPSTTPSVKSMFEAMTPYAFGSELHKRKTQAVATYILRESQPMYTVERPEFKAMLKEFDSRYELPCRSYFNTTVVPKILTNTVTKVKNDLKSAFYYGVTTDMWSSRAMHPYMSITVHYITDDWILENRVLQSLYVPDDHTAELLAQELVSGLEQWGLPLDKIVAISTDNGANIVKACKILNLRRMHCFGHRLNLAVTNALKDNDKTCHRAVALCRKITGHFSHSFKKQKQLKSAQRDLQLPEHSLKNDCETRWGSTFDLIDRTLEQEKAISRVLSGDKKVSHLNLTWQDVSVLESMRDAMEPVSDFTDYLSGDKHATISLVLPTLELFNKTLASTTDDSDLTKSIKSDILTYLKSKYDDDGIDHLPDLMAKATFVDPRFKILTQDDDLKKSIIDDCVKLDVRNAPPECIVVDNLDIAAEPSDPDTVVIDVDAAAAPPPSKRIKPIPSRKRRLSTIFNDLDTPTISSEVRVETEVELYLSMPRINRDADVLAWWKTNQHIYPHLAKLAKQLLCVQATSCASERVFSAAGNIVTCRRSRLKPSRVNDLLFLALNL